MDQAMNVSDQLTAASARFYERFGRPPRYAAAAPGRVNLIGEHTDYNDGFVLPMALDRQTLIVADHATSDTSTLHSTGIATEATFTAPDKADPPWANYVKGVIAGMHERGLTRGPIDVVIDSTVPTGGGLSSSAALEVATATLIEAICGKTIDPVDKALLCQHAEHTYADMPCGIMDQFISTMAREGCAMLLDCRNHNVRHVTLNSRDVAILIINSNVKHELTGSEYPQRRQQCEQAARDLGVNSLRDVSMKALVAAKSHLDPLAYQRAYHVVGEIARTTQAADEIDAGIWASVGRLMYKSHVSLRDHFQVSCPELDLLVDFAQSHVTNAGGAFGSRMTGGGFGGCTVTLVRTDRVDAVAADVCERYKAKTGIDATAFASRPGCGARQLKVPAL